MNGLADHRFDQRLQRGVALAGADGQLEEAVVDRADFDRHGQAVLLAMRLAETGHALQQGGNSKIVRIDQDRTRSSVSVELVTCTPTS